MLLKLQVPVSLVILNSFNIQYLASNYRQPKQIWSYNSLAVTLLDFLLIESTKACISHFLFAFTKGHIPLEKHMSFAFFHTKCSLFCKFKLLLNTPLLKRDGRKENDTTILFIIIINISFSSRVVRACFIISSN